MKNIIKVMIASSLPDANKEPKESIEDKVDRFITAIESNDIDSEYEYNYLKSLYKHLLSCKNLKPRFRLLRSKLKDVMMKHGKYDNDSSLLNGEDLFKDQDLDNCYKLDDY